MRGEKRAGNHQPPKQYIADTNNTNKVHENKQIELEQTQNLIDVYESALATFISFERKAEKDVLWCIQQIVEYRHKIKVKRRYARFCRHEQGAYKKLLGIAFQRKWQLQQELDKEGAR
jgi:hypothetical protein